jgi:transcriptional/translational regulatory protein YebC/TACO1
MAGHSKFKNIMHRKGAQDKKRAKLFSRLIREISVSAKLGSPDPDSNPRLRSAINNALSSNMTKESIDKAIKKQTSTDDKDLIEEIIYEGFGPNGNLGVSGCVKHNFKKVGIISYKKSISTFEDFFDYCASLDVDDVAENENDFVLETNLDSFNTILQKLEDKFSIPKFSEIEWKPLNFIDISDEDSAKVLIKLLETLEDLDDVQSVSSNFNISDSLMDKII